MITNVVVNLLKNFIIYEATINLYFLQLFLKIYNKNDYF